MRLRTKCFRNRSMVRSVPNNVASLCLTKSVFEYSVISAIILSVNDSQPQESSFIETGRTVAVHMSAAGKLADAWPPPLQARIFLKKSVIEKRVI